MGGLLGPKKDRYKVCSLLDKAHPKFWVQAAEDSQFCQALRHQNGSKGLVWHYINIDAMAVVIYFSYWNLIKHLTKTFWLWGFTRNSTWRLS